MDYYKILGVERNATPDEIKLAYRRLAAKNHPDKGGDTEAFQKIQEAYNILGDPQKKQQYDAPQHPFFNSPFGPGGGPFGGGPFGSGNPFEDIINQFTRQPRVKIYTVTVFVTLEQVARGDMENVQIQTPEGVKLINIQIPRGIEDGQQVRYERIMPDGMLQVAFRIYKHNKFDRKNLDLYCTERINVFDLILGTKITVKDIFENSLELNIPPKTKPNSTFRIPNHGLDSNQGRGDQYVLIQPEIPDTISDELMALIRKERESK